MPRDFIFDFPVYVATPKDGPPDALAVVRISGTPCIVILTDSDLAERFSEGFDVSVFEVKSHLALAGLLEDAGASATHIIFDPEQGQRRPTLLPLPAVVGQLRRRSD